MPLVRTRSAELSYRDAGSGPPVVMLHATLHDHRDFDGVFDAVATRHRAIALDWPGHGESSLDTGVECSSEFLAETLTEFLDHLDLGPVVLMGNSVGGWASIQRALNRPEAVAGLVLVNTGGFTRPTPVTRSFCAAMGRPGVARRVLPALVPRYVRTQSELDAAIVSRARAAASTPAGIEVATALWRSFAVPSYDMRTAAQAIVAPTLLLWGAKDIVLPIKDGRTAARSIPGSRLVEFPTGHVPFSSRPDAVLSELLPFLELATVGRSTQ